MASNSLSPSDQYFLCRVCSHSVPLREEDFHKDYIHCPRCGSDERRLSEKSVLMTLIFSLTALILYVPANIFPFMTIEIYGSRNSSTIWSGVVTLFEDGSWGIAFIVFLASIVFPLIKILSLFVLSIAAHRKKNAVFHTKLFHFVEAIGRWSMLDVFLLAVLVAIMKLKPWTTVEPEVGALMFGFVVIFTMLASAKFDPQLLWE